MITEAAVKQALSQVIDPALGHDIVSYRMVHSVELRQGEVRVRPVPTLPRVVFGHAATPEANSFRAAAD